MSFDRGAALQYGKTATGDRYSNFPGDDERIFDYLNQYRSTTPLIPSGAVVIKPMTTKKVMCSCVAVATITGIIGAGCLIQGLQAPYTPSIIWGGVFLGASTICFISIVGVAIHNCVKDEPQSKVIVAANTNSIYRDPEAQVV